MNIDILTAFLIGRIVLTATPGPGVLATIIRAISDGFKGSLFFLSGVILCNIIFLLIALYGVSSISYIIGDMFFIIKIIGGIYLIILGIKLFSKDLVINETLGNKNNYQNFLGGFLITAGNPEPILFYASVVPTLIQNKRILIVDALLMIIIIISISFIITGSYCYAASFSGGIINRNEFFRNINKIAGIVMCAIGGYLVFK